MKLKSLFNFKFLSRVFRLQSKFFGTSSYTLEVTEGKLKGKFQKSVRGDIYLSFQGIPYAKAPVGSLRFQAPEPPRKWSGVREALTERLPCPQIDQISGKIIGSEDCLYHNIYVSGTSTQTYKERKPVLVWFSDTGNSSCSLYGPDHFMAQDVVLVSFNYRSGPFGFLSMQDSYVPGNAGLKDQIALLKWVQQNIFIFGGNPKNVTVFGHGLGAVCAHLLALSPSSDGLFHKLICQNGCALSPEGLKTKQEAMNQAYKLAYRLGCQSEDPFAVFNVLKNAPAEKLANIHSFAFGDSNFQSAPFVPSVEPESSKPFVVVSEHPSFIIKNGLFSPVPAIFGCNSKEGVNTFMNLRRKPSPTDVMIGNFQNSYQVTFDSNKLNSFTPFQIKIPNQDFYINQGGSSLGMVTPPETRDANYLLEQVVQDIVKHQRDEPLYMYFFQYKGMTPFFKDILKRDVDQVSEIPYLFHPHSIKSGEGKNLADLAVVNRMTQMWANFARTKNPTPPEDCLGGNTWTPYCSRESNYLDIDETLQLRKNVEYKRLEFWKHLRHMLDIQNEKRIY